MPEQLPPDLSRLGDELVLAMRRRADRRRQAFTTGVAAMLAVAVLASAELRGAAAPPPSPSDAVAVTVYRPVACDQPRGATFAAVRPCASPGATDVEPVLTSRRYAVQ